MKVLLMGNGSSVMDNKLGEKIDNDFDLVFRINRFRTKKKLQFIIISLYC